MFEIGRKFNSPILFEKLRSVIDYVRKNNLINYSVNRQVFKMHHSYAVL